MRAGIPTVALVVTMAFGTTPLPADDLSRADAFLCAAVQATGCAVDDECVVATPSHWNIPQFIEIDLVKKILSTTKASGEFRTTPIKHVERGDGLIVIQGTEAGRAFSFVITEENGTASVAVARDGVTIAVFGSCTPLPAVR